MIKLNNFYIGESVSFIRKNIPDEFIDLTITSPPYDDLRTYKGFVFDYKSMFKELYRVTKQGGVVVWVVGDATIKGSETGTSFKHVLYAKEKIGFNLHDTMIYQKNNYPFPPSNRYYQQFEYMFVFSKGSPKTSNLIKCEAKGRKRNSTQRNKDGTTTKFYSEGNKFRIMDNIWKIDAGYMRTTKDKIAFNHPAIFPDKLAGDHIISWSNEGDIVLDPMCGAGTTCKMAWLNNRKFIGIDMSEEYINEICIPRLEMYGWKQEENKNTNINILTN